MCYSLGKASCFFTLCVCHLGWFETYLLVGSLLWVLAMPVKAPAFGDHGHLRLAPRAGVD